MYPTEILFIDESKFLHCNINLCSLSIDSQLSRDNIPHADGLKYMVSIKGDFKYLILTSKHVFISRFLIDFKTYWSKFPHNVSILLGFFKSIMFFVTKDDILFDTSFSG